eukprot:9379643-Pyramimonas_sp.AAC.1
MPSLILAMFCVWSWRSGGIAPFLVVSRGWGMACIAHQVVYEVYAAWGAYMAGVAPTSSNADEASSSSSSASRRPSPTVVPVVVAVAVAVARAPPGGSWGPTSAL